MAWRGMQGGVGVLSEGFLLPASLLLWVVSCRVVPCRAVGARDERDGVLNRGADDAGARVCLAIPFSDRLSRES